jgi:hypothetical protein
MNHVHVAAEDKTTRSAAPPRDSSNQIGATLPETLVLYRYTMLGYHVAEAPHGRLFVPRRVDGVDAHQRLRQRHDCGQTQS